MSAHKRNPSYPLHAKTIWQQRVPHVMGTRQIEGSEGEKRLKKKPTTTPHTQTQTHTHVQTAWLQSATGKSRKMKHKHVPLKTTKMMSACSNTLWGSQPGDTAVWPTRGRFRVIDLGDRFFFSPKSYSQICIVSGGAALNGENEINIKNKLSPISPKGFTSAKVSAAGSLFSYKMDLDF